MAKLTLPKFLLRHRAVVLDTMVFIYEFEAHPKFSALTHGIFQALEAGKCRGVISVITLHELLVKPKKQAQLPLVLQYRYLLTHSPFLTVADVTAEIAEAAAGLRAKYPLAAPDALIAASGLAHGATGLITADKKMRQIQELTSFILV